MSTSPFVNVYRNTPRLGLAVLIKLLARFAMSLEIWVAAYWMGHPISLIEAFMFRSLIATVRGAAFFIPQGLGVQESRLYRPRWLGWYFTGTRPIHIAGNPRTRTDRKYCRISIVAASGGSVVVGIN